MSLKYEHSSEPLHISILPSKPYTRRFSLLEQHSEVFEKLVEAIGKDTSPAVWTRPLSIPHVPCPYQGNIPYGMDSSPVHTTRPLYIPGEHPPRYGLVPCPYHTSPVHTTRPLSTPHVPYPYHTSPVHTKGISPTVWTRPLSIPHVPCPYQGRVPCGMLHSNLLSSKIPTGFTGTTHTSRTKFQICTEFVLPDAVCFVPTSLMCPIWGGGSS